MEDWHSFARTVRDYFPEILFGVLVLVLLAAWAVFETFRRTSSVSELSRLRRKVDELEAARAYSYRATPTSADEAVGEVVLPARWVRRGAAATSSDGGCLLIVDTVTPGRRGASITVRVDGWPGVRHEVRQGHSFDVTGNMGTYNVELAGVNTQEACLSVTLKSRHIAEGN